MLYCLAHHLVLTYLGDPARSAPRSATARRALLASKTGAEAPLAAPTTENRLTLRPAGTRGGGGGAV